jgi:hypothetical protein
MEEYRIRYELTACMKFKNAARFLLTLFAVWSLRGPCRLSMED